MSNVLASALTSLPDTTTTNGMGAYKSTLNACLDFFTNLSAFRADQVLGLSKFQAAFSEDPLTALRILFYARDIRGGQGERDFPRLAFSYLAKSNPELMRRNFHLIPVYGRWDDLLSFVGSSIENLVFDFWCDAIKKGDGLSSKWACREGGANKAIAINYFIPRFGSPKKYRKAIVAASKTVEQLMCAQKFDEITYSHVPSQAMKLYRNAFKAHSPTRWEAYLSAVKAGTQTIKASTLYPYDIWRKIPYSGTIDESLELQWRALPDYMKDVETNVIPICDVSGSMTSPFLDESGLTPLMVCMSLGAYMGAHNKGVWHNSIISFSSKPTFHRWLDTDTLSTIKTIISCDVGYDTNLTATFDLILNVAVTNKVPQSDMPKKLVIFSDMQFNSSVVSNGYSQTAVQMIRTRYQNAGYEVPELVFWNLTGTPSNTPVRNNDLGVCMVSGFSPSTLKFVLGGKITTSFDMMMEIVNSPRYEAVSL